MVGFTDTPKGVTFAELAQNVLGCLCQSESEVEIKIMCFLQTVILGFNSLFALTMIVLPTLNAADSGPKILISTPEQVGEDASLVNCNDEERLNAVRLLFTKMGARDEEIRIEKFENVENVVLRKPGISEEVIVIGAHFDKAPEGCGAVDNWSGIVAMAHVYKTFLTFPTQKTLLFVAFGKEEKGLVGSEAMARAIHPAMTKKYCAMVNLDSLGMGAPQVVKNLSNDKLAMRTAEIANRMEMPFGQDVIYKAGADSQSFMKKGIPAVTIHGLTDDFVKVLHKPNDQPSIVIPDSVYLGYRLALSLIREIDTSPCNSFR